MNEKVNIQSLSELLSQRHGLSKDSADDFVREFFNLITEGLEKDHLVKIKGLGTFKVIDVEDRESVDVNTKERIVIKGHSKVTFTPEATLKEAINKPFEAFETTILDDSTPLEAMTRIPEEDDTLMTIQELYGKVNDEDPAKTKHEEILSGLKEDLSEIGSIPSDTVTGGEASSQAESMDAGTEGKEPAFSGASQEQETSEPEETPKPTVSEGDANGTNQEIILPNAPEQPKPLEEEDVNLEDLPVIKDATPEPEPLKVAVLEPVQEEKKKKKTQDKAGQSSGKALKVFSWIILLLILLCGLFVASLYKDDILSWFNREGKSPAETLAPALEKTDPVVAAPVQMDTVLTAQPTAVVDTATVTPSAAPTQEIKDDPKATSQVKPEDIKTSEVKVPAAPSKATAPAQSPTIVQPAATSASSSKTQSQAKPDAKSTSVGTSTSGTQKLKEGVSYKIDGTLTTHVIKSGETLRSIALKYYGSKSFSSYIVQHNAKTIKNPDNVPAGSKISIPKLVEK